VAKRTNTQVSRSEPRPTLRPLRVYTFDPAVGKQLDTAMIVSATLCVPWEELEPGPKGEYLEVVDYDPSCDCFYEPVNLNTPFVLNRAVGIVKLDAVVISGVASLPSSHTRYVSLDMSPSTSTPTQVTLMDANVVSVGRGLSWNRTSGA